MPLVSSVASLLSELRDAPVVRQVRRGGRALVTIRAELAQSFAVLAGWALLTSAVAHLAPHVPVWSLSAGLLLLSLAGWKFLGEMAWKGLYALDAEDREARRRG